MLSERPPPVLVSNRWSRVKPAADALAPSVMRRRRGRVATTGALESRSSWRCDSTVGSAYSRTRAKPVPRPRPASIAARIRNRRGGHELSCGARAQVMTRALVESIPVCSLISRERTRKVL